MATNDSKKMKKTVVSMLLTGLVLSVAAKEPTVKGPVMRITKTTYTETRKFGDLQLEPQRGVVTWYINADGNICHKRTDDKYERKETSFIYENGKKIKTITTKPGKATLEGIVYDTIGVETWKYVNGNCVEHIEMNGHHDTIAMETWVYDKAGREIDVCKYKNKKLIKRSRYEYNAAGYKNYVYGSNGDLDSEWEKKGNDIYGFMQNGTSHIVYDSRGNVIKMVVESNDESRVSVSTTHDKYGNVTYTHSYGNGPFGIGRTEKEERFKYDYDPYGNIKTEYRVDQNERVVYDIVYAKTNADYASVGQMIKNDIKVYDDEIFKREYERLRREKEEKDAREAEARRLIKIKELVHRDSMLKDSLLSSRKENYKQFLTRFKFRPYSSKYPYIFDVIMFIDRHRYRSVENSKSNAFVYHTCDRYYNIYLPDLIRAQKVLVNTAKDPQNKKEMKKLEKSLKKASTYDIATDLLSDWLASKGCKVNFSSPDSISQDLYNRKENIEKTLSGYAYRELRRLSLLYIENWLLSSDKATWTKEGVEKVIEINTFVSKLYTDESLKAEREAFEVQVKDLDKSAKAANVSLDVVRALMFEEFIKAHGITIPGR